MATLVVMVRFVLGCLVYLIGAVVLGGFEATSWSFPLPILAIGTVGILGGLLMGLHEEPPPWRRRHTAK